MLRPRARCLKVPTLRFEGPEPEKARSQRAPRPVWLEPLLAPFFTNDITPRGAHAALKFHLQTDLPNGTHAVLFHFHTRLANTSKCDSSHQHSPLSQRHSHLTHLANTSKCDSSRSHSPPTRLANTSKCDTSHHSPLRNPKSKPVFLSNFVPDRG